MGSGTGLRKRSDTVFIKKPKQAAVIAGGGGIQFTDTDQTNNICVVSFETKVKKSSLTVPGVKITFRKTAGGYNLLIGENQIGKLRKKDADMVSLCKTLGVEYSGQIIERKNEVYARFYRIS